MAQGELSCEPSSQAGGKSQRVRRVSRNTKTRCRELLQSHDKIYDEPTDKAHTITALNLNSTLTTTTMTDNDDDTLVRRRPRRSTAGNRLVSAILVSQFIV